MTTERESILAEAQKNVSADREATYGPPNVNLACAGELQAVYLKYSKGAFGPAHENAMLMQLAKAARIATGPVFHRDNYVDASGYAALAGEVGAEFQKEEDKLLNENYVREIVEERALASLPINTSSNCTCGANSINAKSPATERWLHRRDCPASPYKTSSSEYANFAFDVSRQPK